MAVELVARMLHDVRDLRHERRALRHELADANGTGDPGPALALSRRFPVLRPRAAARGSTPRSSRSDRAVVST